MLVELARLALQTVMYIPLRLEGTTASVPLVIQLAMVAFVQASSFWSLCMYGETLCIPGVLGYVAMGDKSATMTATGVDEPEGQENWISGSTVGFECFLAPGAECLSWWPHMWACLIKRVLEKRWLES
jgi:hypothetical protein